VRRFDAAFLLSFFGVAIARAKEKKESGVKPPNSKDFTAKNARELIK